MKTRILCFLVFGFVTVAAFAAYTRTAYRCISVTAKASYANAAATSPNSVVLSGAFERRYVNDSDANDFEESESRLQVSVDLLAAPTTQTTVSVGGGITITDAQGAAWLRKRLETAAGL